MSLMELLLKWHSKSYLGMNKVTMCLYPFYIFKLLSKNKPDIIIAASDIPHIIMGELVSKKARYSICGGSL